MNSFCSLTFLNMKKLNSFCSFKADWSIFFQMRGKSTKWGLFLHNESSVAQSHIQVMTRFTLFVQTIIFENCMSKTQYFLGIFFLNVQLAILHSLQWQLIAHFVRTGLTLCWGFFLLKITILWNKCLKIYLHKNHFTVSRRLNGQ